MTTLYYYTNLQDFIYVDVANWLFILHNSISDIFDFRIDSVQCEMAIHSTEPTENHHPCLQLCVAFCHYQLTLFELSGTHIDLMVNSDGSHKHPHYNTVAIYSKQQKTSTNGKWGKSTIIQVTRRRHSSQKLKDQTKDERKVNTGPKFVKVNHSNVTSWWCVRAVCSVSVLESFCRLDVKIANTALI